MIDVIKFYDRLDQLDPRLNPIVIDPYASRSSDTSPDKILKRNLQNAEILMAVLNDSCDNLLRLKGGSVIRAIQNAREAVAAEENNEHNEGQRDHFVMCGQVAINALGLSYWNTSPDDIKDTIQNLVKTIQDLTKAKS